MAARTQQDIAPITESGLMELFIDELNQQFSSPLDAFRQSQYVPGDKPKQGLPQGIGLPTVSEKSL